jgi:hypothetical protein
VRRVVFVGARTAEILVVVNIIMNSYLSFLPSFVGFWRPCHSVAIDRSILLPIVLFIDRWISIDRFDRRISVSIGYRSRFFFFSLSFRLLLRMDGWIDRIYLDVVVWVSSM